MCVSALRFCELGNVLSFHRTCTFVVLGAVSRIHSSFNRVHKGRRASEELTRLWRRRLEAGLGLATTDDAANLAQVTERA